MANKENGNKRLVAVKVFTNSFDANLALTKLRSEGVACILDGETISDVWGGAVAMPFSGIRLMVNAADEERATAILENLED